MDSADPLEKVVRAMTAQKGWATCPRPCQTHSASVSQNVSRFTKRVKSRKSKERKNKNPTVQAESSLRESGLFIYGVRKSSDCCYSRAGVGLSRRVLPGLLHRDSMREVNKGSRIKVESL